MFTLNEFVEMRARLRERVRATPLLYSDALSALTGNQVYLKAENLQRTHSFKLRAAYGGLLPKLEAARRHGVVTGSSGNFAQAIAYAGRELGARVTVVMFERSAANKVEATRQLGAEVVFCANDFSLRTATVERIVREQGKLLVHSFDDEGVIVGNGSLGFELLEQIPDADVLLVPVSGGGLISGTAAVLRQSGSRARIYGVQSEANPSMKVSLARGEPTQLPDAVTVADGLIATRPGRLTFGLVQQYVDDILLVSEEEIVAATVRLLEEEKLVVEPSGAVGVAALLRHLAGKIQKQKIVAVLSGGNIETSRLVELVQARSRAAAPVGS
ncbi:MAG: threonine/serine dehydratase [Acidobacteria bacterium]|nr:threonine/serine dehydratase [Acidobacteriota bacterium]